MLRNIVYFLLSVTVFFTGVLLYGAALNSRDVPLAEVMKRKGLKKLENVSIIIHKSNYTLDLYSDTIHVKSYRVVFGMSSKPRKIGSNLKSTPIGRYKICDKVPNYYFGKLIKINFPNFEDAVSGLRAGTIGLKEFNKIEEAIALGECPPVKAPDNEIGIHGTGKLNFIFKHLPFSYNWTGGSAALSDENLEEIYSIINIGDKVVIKN